MIRWAIELLLVLPMVVLVVSLGKLMNSAEKKEQRQRQQKIHKEKFQKENEEEKRNKKAHLKRKKHPQMMSARSVSKRYRQLTVIIAWKIGFVCNANSHRLLLFSFCFFIVVRLYVYTEVNLHRTTIATSNDVKPAIM